MSLQDRNRHHAPSGQTGRAYDSDMSADSVRHDELETPRLILRRWQEADLEHLARVLVDSTVMGALNRRSSQRVWSALLDSRVSFLG